MNFRIVGKWWKYYVFKYRDVEKGMWKLVLFLQFSLNLRTPRSECRERDIKKYNLNDIFEDWWYGELKLVSSWFDDWCFEIFVLTIFWIISDLWESGVKIMMSEKGSIFQYTFRQKQKYDKKIDNILVFACITELSYQHISPGGYCCNTSSDIHPYRPYAPSCQDFALTSPSPCDPDSTDQ